VLASASSELQPVRELASLCIPAATPSRPIMYDNHSSKYLLGRKKHAIYTETDFNFSFEEWCINCLNTMSYKMLLEAGLTFFLSINNKIQGSSNRGNIPNRAIFEHLNGLFTRDE